MISYHHISEIPATDLNQIIDLFSQNFTGEHEQLKNRFLAEFKQFDPLQWIIARHQDQVVGALLLRMHKMNYCGVKLSVCGMSYMAIVPDFQRSEVAETFKKMAIDAGSNADISLGFARKKMDGYWSPYGFIGITDFGEFSINALNINLFDSDYSIQIVDATIADTKTIEKLYYQLDDQLTGNLVRQSKQFEHAIADPNYRGQVKCFVKDEAICGYMIIKEDRIKEIRIDDTVKHQIAFSLKKYFQQQQYPIIYFNTFLNDPFLKFLSQFSHEQKTRYAFEGGHILRISNISDFLQKIRPVLLKRLNQFNLKSLQLKNDHLSISYLDGEININLSKNYDLAILTKLVFGIVPSDDEKWQMLFGHLHCQIPAFDEF